MRVRNGGAKVKGRRIRSKLNRADSSGAGWGREGEWGIGNLNFSVGRYFRLERVGFRFCAFHAADQFQGALFVPSIVLKGGMYATWVQVSSGNRLVSLAIWSFPYYTFG
jgi:hypothetical protein